MSKYIDLYEAMDEDIALAGRERAAVVDALRWLDEHPDRVPGRTITESRYAAEARDRSLTYMRGFDAALIEFGATVTPDPVPTNTELIEKAIFDSMSTASIVTSVDVKILADRLDARGVKAPGGDDD